MIVCIRQGLYFRVLWCSSVSLELRTYTRRLLKQDLLQGNGIGYGRTRIIVCSSNTMPNSSAEFSIVGIFLHLFSTIPAGFLSIFEFIPAIRNVSIMRALTFDHRH